MRCDTVDCAVDGMCNACRRNPCGLDVRSKSAELLPGPWRGASPEVPGICNSADVCFAGQRNDEEKFLGHLFHPFSHPLRILTPRGAGQICRVLPRPRL